MLRKLLITQWFGDLPDWYPLWLANVGSLSRYGYDVLIDTDLEGVRRRVQNLLGVEFPGVEGGTKMHDLRPALGVLYEEEIAGYDFYGHTDLDCVYGRVGEWLPDAVLGELDVHSNHDVYMCGPWSLYRNERDVRELFLDVPDWRDLVADEETSGWVETTYSALVDARHDDGELRRLYSLWQGNRIGHYDEMRWDGERLMDGDTEIFMTHFNRTKTYPPGCRIA